MMGSLINLPTDLLQKEKYEVMPPSDKERYIYTALKKILELNPNGITITMIKKATGFTYSTVWHHLEKMVATREGYKLDYGNTIIYFPNGKMVHHLKSEDMQIGDRGYSFYVVVNNFGKFVYLQEKKENRLGLTEVCGGLLIPYENLDEFIESLVNMKEKSKKLIVEVEKNV